MRVHPPVFVVRFGFVGKEPCVGGGQQERGRVIVLIFLLAVLRAVARPKSVTIRVIRGSLNNLSADTVGLWPGGFQR